MVKFVAWNTHIPYQSAWVKSQVLYQHAPCKAAEDGSLPPTQRDDAWVPDSWHQPGLAQAFMAIWGVIQKTEDRDHLYVFQISENKQFKKVSDYFKNDYLNCEYVEVIQIAI